MQVILVLWLTVISPDLSAQTRFVESPQFTMEACERVRASLESVTVQRVNKSAETTFIVKALCVPQGLTE